MFNFNVNGISMNKNASIQLNHYIFLRNKIERVNCLLNNFQIQNQARKILIKNSLELDFLTED